jgi:hypothetical protein
MGCIGSRMKSQEIAQNEIKTIRQNLKQFKACLLEENNMRNGDNHPTHVTKGNVLDDLGFSLEELVVLKLKPDSIKRS